MKEIKFDPEEPLAMVLIALKKEAPAFAWFYGERIEVFPETDTYEMFRCMTCQQEAAKFPDIIKRVPHYPASFSGEIDGEGGCLITIYFADPWNDKEAVSNSAKHYAELRGWIFMYLGARVYTLPPHSASSVDSSLWEKAYKDKLVKDFVGSIS